ncbi:hypothetical protein OH77DRAFT_1492976 [Trametes cingulata]|nr:hypothetical protein OH77DRAFT_1492976 [Trametes cingulata]
MLKRPRDVFDTPDSSSPPAPATKRRYVSSSSLAASSPSSSARPLSALSTPYTLPYFRSPYTNTVPHDSPSNPFGLNRALRALTLPRPTGFSKHIVVRMQLVSVAESTGARSRRTSLSEAPYRIVQVPLNYSFRLLHMLVLFLFASDARLRVRRRKRVTTRDLRAREASSSSRKAKQPKEASGDAPEAQGEGHLFEVYEDIKLYTNTYRPGVIKSGSGKLYARLSSTRERKLFPDDQPVQRNTDVDVFGDADMADENEDDEDGWVWEAEDDFLLSNVWTDGPSLKKGIIYHHTPSTAIHITVNQARVPPRKGIGNAPHVFAARGGTEGAVRIANIASSPSSSPPPSSSKPSATKPPSSSTHAKGKRKQRDHSDSEGDSFSDTSSSDDDDGREEKRPFVYDGDEVPDLGAREEASEEELERWNAHNAFDRFLKREAARERGMRRFPNPPSTGPRAPAAGPRAGRTGAAGGGYMSSPLKPRGTTHRYGHRYASAGVDDADADMGMGEGEDDDPEDALPPSSPSTLPLPLPPSDCDALYTDTDGALSSGSERPAFPYSGDMEAQENMRYMIELPLQTPFPAHPAVRRRVRRASERMERQVVRGLGEMDADEDEEGEGDGEEAGKEKGEGAGEKERKAEKRDVVKKGKENAATQAKASTKVVAKAAAQPRPSTQQNQRPAAQAQARPAARKALAVVAPPTPESDRDSPSGSGSGSGSSDGDDGYNANGAPWLRMRGPEDGSSEGTGGWDSDEV